MVDNDSKLSENPQNFPCEFASLDDFKEIDLSSLLAEEACIDDHNLSSILLNAANVAREANELGAARAYRLLGLLFSFHNRIDDVSRPYHPMHSGLSRSCMPSDFSGPQGSVLIDALSEFGHPAVRARIADVVWLNNKSLGWVAHLTVDSYCELIRGRIDGEYSCPYPEAGDTISDVVNLLQRATQIARKITKGGAIPERLSQLHEQLFRLAFDRSDFSSFLRLARLGLEYKVIKYKDIKGLSEQLAQQATNASYAIEVRDMYLLAAEAYRHCNDHVAMKRCQSKSVDQTLRMRIENNTALASADWTRTAINELISFGGFTERITILRKELREFEERSLEEVTTFTMPFDLTSERKSTEERFEHLPCKTSYLNLHLW